MARRTAVARGSAKGKLLTFLAVALLIYWAGRDPAGAAAFARHIGDAIGTAAHHHSHPKTTRP